MFGRNEFLTVRIIEDVPACNYNLYTEYSKVIINKKCACYYVLRRFRPDNTLAVKGDLLAVSFNIGRRGKVWQ